LTRIPLGWGAFLHGLRREWTVRNRLSPFVRPLHRYYTPIRLPGTVRGGRSVTDLPRPDREPGQFRPAPGSPGFHERSVRACTGSLTPQVRAVARSNATLDIAFPTKSQGRHTGRVISELNSWPARPLSTLRRHLTDDRRMTRGHGGSLLLTM
jgi:hypothetical protein